MANCASREFTNSKGKRVWGVFLGGKLIETFDGKQGEARSKQYAATLNEGDKKPASAPESKPTVDSEPDKGNGKDKGKNKGK